MEQTTARLRKTFQYKPDDNDSDDSLPEALDEQEQESLITSLRAQNTLRNTQYKHLFLSLPLLCTLAYLPTLFRPSTSVPSLLSISSLLASAYVLYFLPALPSLLVLPWTTSDGGNGNGDPHSSVRMGKGLTAAGGVGVEKGPLELYLPYLNAVLVALLAVAGFVGRQRAEEGEGEGFWFALLPGLVYWVVVAAKGIMDSVDVGELEGLRYGYKGA